MEISLYNETLSDKPVYGRYTKIKRPIYVLLTGTIAFISSTGVHVITNSKFKIKSEKDESISVIWDVILNGWVYKSLSEPK